MLDQCARTEKLGGKPSLPLWLSPSQVRLIPVKPEFLEHAKKLADQLAASHVRADLDDRDESLDRRVRDAELNWIPYVAVVGKREAETQMLAIRRRSDGKRYNVGLPELVKEISDQSTGYPVMAQKLPILISERPGYKQLG